MILTYNDSQEFFKVVESSRKIGRVAITEADCARAFHTINGINMLTDKQSIFNGEVITHYEMLKEATELIVPGKITYSGEDYERDLRAGDYKKYDPMNYGFTSGTEYMSAREFKNFWYGVAGSRKKDASFTVIDDSLKGNQKLADFEKREMIGSYEVGNDTRKGVVDSTYVIPVKLTVQIREDFKFNMDVERMLTEWTDDMLNSLT